MNWMKEPDLPNNVKHCPTAVFATMIAQYLISDAM